MNTKSRRFKAVDILLLAGAILPLLAAIVLKVLTTPASEGINITDLTNKSKKDMAVTVMDMADLPTEDAIAKIKALPGVIRVRTFA